MWTRKPRKPASPRTEVRPFSKRGQEKREQVEEKVEEVEWKSLDDDVVGPEDNDGIIGWKRFRPVIVKEAIHQVLMENLQGMEYNGEECTDLTKSLSDQIKAKLREVGYDRYKFIVQVVIGEQRGEGVKMGCRCFWDSDTDNYAQDIFMNDSLFCVAAAFGVFYY